MVDPTAPAIWLIEYALNSIEIPMPKIKVHEDFYSIDTSDEWKDRTIVSVYIFDTEAHQLLVERTRSFRDYRTNTQTTDPTTVEAVPLDKAPSIVLEMLRERGLVRPDAI